MKKYIISLIVVVAFVLQTYAQDRALTHFNSVPQSIENNPSFTIPYKFYMGFPGLSSTNIVYQNVFSYSSAVKKRDDDSLYIDPKAFLSEFKKNNLISLETKLDFLDFGFRVKKNFFYFTQSLRANLNLWMPGDFMQLLIKGNASFVDEDRPLETNMLRINASAFTETTLGYQRNLTDRINIGARFKFLLGLANANTKDSYLYLHTNPGNYFLTANGRFNAGYSTLIDFEDENFKFEPSTLFQNKGFAIDLGGTYRFSDQLAVGASIHDLGFIKWQTNTQSFEGGLIRDEFVFGGVPLEVLFIDSRINSDIFKEISDTIMDNFYFTDTTKSAYTTMLPTKVCLDAYYILGKNNVFGAYYRSDFINGLMLPSLTLSYNRKLGRILQVGASYGIAYQQYNKLGLGLSLKTGPSHFFITTENIFSFTNVAKMKNIYVHFGYNIVFGKWREALLDANRTSVDF